MFKKKKQEEEVIELSTADQLRQTAEQMMQDKTDQYISNIIKFLSLTSEQGSTVCAYPLNSTLEHFERFNSVIGYLEDNLGLTVSITDFNDSLTTTKKKKFLIIYW